MIMQVFLPPNAAAQVSGMDSGASFNAPKVSEEVLHKFQVRSELFSASLA